MTDPGVQLVREWLQRQPFSLRFLTLLLFMEEAVKDEFGEETMNSFEHLLLSNFEPCIASTKEFIGLVHVNSLHTKAEYIDYLRAEIAKREASGEKPIPESFATTNLRDYARKLEAL
jgi:hypothetical protein